MSVQEFQYNDLITGKTVTVKQKKIFKNKGNKFLSEGNYRCSLDFKFTCGTCKNKTGVKKCEIVGVSDSSASDINLGYVCNLWRPETLDRKEYIKLRKEYKESIKHEDK
jgi:hypothetical protein